MADKSAYNKTEDNSLKPTQKSRCENSFISCKLDFKLIPKSIFSTFNTQGIHSSLPPPPHLPVVAGESDGTGSQAWYK